MHYSFIHFYNNQMAIQIALLLILFFIFCIIVITFYLFSKETINKIKKIIAISKENKKEDIDDRYNSLNNKQINFYFDIGQKSLNNIFKHRDEENKNILSHVAIFGAVLSFFYFLGKWTYEHHNDLSYFIPLIIFLCAALFHIVTAIWSISVSLGLPYVMQPQLYEIPKEYTDSSVKVLKKMYIERYANDAKKNHRSNIHKMYLLEYSRFFLRNAIIFLGIAFLFICGKECISFIYA